MKIMFDIDGVLACFIGGFTKLASELIPGVPVTTTLQQPSWHGFPGMTKEQVSRVWEVVKADCWFWTELEPLVGGLTFKDIYDIKVEHEVYFCTSRVGIYAKRQTEHWLASQGLGNTTVIVSGKKGEFCKAVGIDYAIEDKASNASCIDWITEGKTKSYLINRPYNQAPAEFLGSGIKRVDTVNEFLEVLNANR